MFRCLGIYGYWIDWINLMFLCNQTVHNFRSSRPEVFLRKGVLKICSKFTGEHPCICWKMLRDAVQTPHNQCKGCLNAKTRI